MFVVGIALKKTTGCEVYSYSLPNTTVIGLLFLIVKRILAWHEQLHLVAATISIIHPKLVVCGFIHWLDL